MKREHLPSAAMNVNHGQVFEKGLMKTAVILSLHQVIPIDRRSSSRRHRGRHQWLTHVLKNLPNRPRLSDEADQPDITAAIRARQRKRFSQTRPTHSVMPPTDQRKTYRNA